MNLPEFGPKEHHMYSHPAYLFFAAFLISAPAIDAYTPLDCLNDIARVDTTINVGLATKLCSATWSPEPVKCYMLVAEADEGIIRSIAIDLCAGTVNAQKTVDCYIAAGSERKLNRGLSTTLCGAKKSEK